ncbi:F-box/kelch-repeat protein At3g06240-like [Cornus florida]|uniref:F-box/kelch-repeat protein At3g06240-like n=1 Tax=Cornus florida TaxID=4283 RepID=UPI0028A294D8|nr:F-box/kelch-repeat protein At3g06240-like [Cornus florida]
MSVYLPNELLTDILARLPVRTLLQIRCVCKSWRSLISSDYFVTFCLNRSTHLNNINHTHLLLIRHCTEREIREHFYSGKKIKKQEHFSLYLDNEGLTEYQLNIERRPIADIGPYFTILGSCNGLVCLIDDSFASDLLYLLNPTISKFVVLPEPRVTSRSHGHYHRALGFGFDSTTNDYKVVRIVYPYGSTTEIDIYSLKQGCWRNISVSGPIPCICDSSHVSLNGTIHWVSGGGDFPGQSIVTFNLSTEVFSWMELPRSLLYKEAQCKLSVAVFQDSLFMFENDYSIGKASIWMMKQYGVVESWTNLFSVDFARGGSVKVIGWKRNGEVLLTKDKEMVSIDIKTQKLTNLGMHGYDEAFCVKTYTESLVLIDKVNGGSHI